MKINTFIQTCFNRNNVDPKLRIIENTIKNHTDKNNIIKNGYVLEKLKFYSIKIYMAKNEVFLSKFYKKNIKKYSLTKMTNGDIMKEKPLFC